MSRSCAFERLAGTFVHTRGCLPRGERTQSPLVKDLEADDLLQILKREKKTWRQTNLTGFRMGTAVSSLVSACILIINVGLFIWAMLNHETENGLGIFYRGSCAAAKTKSSWLQIVFNVQSSLLLSISNYCMQCLNAPTREEVDKCHAKKTPLCIGAPSFTNLKNISRGKAVVWILLGISALPIHFLNNSMLMLATQGNQYRVMAAPQGFLSPGFNDLDYYDFADCTTDTVSHAQEFRNGIVSGRFEKLNPEQRYLAYSQQYVSRHGDLMIIQDGTVLRGNSNCTLAGNWGPFHKPDTFTANGGGYGMTLLSPSLNPAPNGVRSSGPTWLLKPFPYVSDPQHILSYSWQIAFPDVPDVDSHFNYISRPKTFDNWRPFGGTVKYCYSEPVEEDCTLNFDLLVSLAVLICMSVKTCCTFLAAIWSRRPALVNLGDAIESFMHREDPHTTGLCTLGAKQIDLLFSMNRIYDAWPGHSGQSEKRIQVEKSILQKWQPKSHRLWQSASPSRFHCFFIFVAALFAGVGALGHIRMVDGPFPFNVGTQAGRNQINLQTTPSGAVLIANMPQLLCSYVFLGFNYLLTCMYAGYEWTSYANRRKPLRVTDPAGKQRSTFYLQLPFRYAIPLLALSCLLSWLTSQVLFVVLVQIRGSHSLPVEAHTMVTCGYSPGAIALTIIIGSVIASSIFLIGLRKYPDNMPLAGTNSAAIAAACHALPEDRDRVTERLQWGVVSEKNGVGHCAFSSETVGPLIPGKK